MKTISPVFTAHLLINTLLSTTLYAATPVWTFWPQTPTSLTVAPGETAEIQYLVKNQSTRPKNLVMRPIKGVTPNGVCTLSAKGHCVLTLTINGSQLTKDVIGGPILCEKGNAHQCYRPSPADILRLFKKESPTVASFFAVGSYTDTHILQRPLLATSHDNGQSWIFPSAVNAPIFTPSNTNPFGNSGLLLNISCQNQNCVTVGYYNEGTETKPLLAVSQDNGINWVFPAATNAPVFTPSNALEFFWGDFGDVSCAGNHCVAVGGYTAKNTTQHRPIIGVSHDSGQNWTFPSDPTKPVFTPNNTQAFLSGFLGRVNCQDSLCISAGNYSTGLLPRPLLAISHNNGDTWIYPSATNSPFFTPSNTYPFQEGLFSDANCVNSTCVASGYYVDTNDDFRALLAISQDSGTTWRFPSSITAPVFTPNNTHAYDTGGQFNTSHCSEKSCIAAGLYYDGTVQRPLLAVSQNKGNTWFFPSAINECIFTPDNTYAYNQLGVFLSTYCEASLCLAVGNYNDTNHVQRPLLAISQDAGTTWTYPSSINAPVFTPDNSNAFNGNASLTSVSCQHNKCIASGRYSDMNNIQRPLVAISLDGGKTWTYPSSPNAPIFTPSNANAFQESGQFNDSSVKTSFWLSDALKPLQ